MGTALDATAEQLVELGRLDEAESIVKERLAELEASVSPGHRFALRPLTIAGQIAERRGRLGQARTHYETALAGVAAGSDPDDPRAAEPLFGLARVRLAEGDRQQAMAHAKRALALASGHDPVLVAAIEDLLAKAERATSGR